MPDPAIQSHQTTHRDSRLPLKLMIAIPSLSPGGRPYIVHILIPTRCYPNQIHYPPIPCPILLSLVSRISLDRTPTQLWWEGLDIQPLSLIIKASDSPGCFPIILYDHQDLMLITLEMDCRRQCNIKLLAGGAVRITAAFPWRALASNRWRTRQRLISVYLSASLEALLARVCTTTCSVFTQHINNVTPVTQDHFHSINACQDHQIQCNTTQYPETSSRVPQPNPRKITPKSRGGPCL